MSLRIYKFTTYFIAVCFTIWGLYSTFWPEAAKNQVIEMTGLDVAPSPFWLFLVALVISITGTALPWVLKKKVLVKTDFSHHQYSRSADGQEFTNHGIPIESGAYDNLYVSISFYCINRRKRRVFGGGGCIITPDRVLTLLSGASHTKDNTTHAGYSKYLKTPFSEERIYLSLIHI